MQLTARSPKIMVSADGQGLVSQSGALLLAEAARVTGPRKRVTETRGSDRSRRHA